MLVVVHSCQVPETYNPLSIWCWIGVVPTISLTFSDVVSDLALPGFVDSPTQTCHSVAGSDFALYTFYECPCLTLVG